MTDETETPKAPLEFRYAGVQVGNVDFANRIITVIAVPYEESALVEYRSEMWNEIFSRGSLDAVAAAPHRVRVNRDHNKSRTVGKAIQFRPDSDEGLVTEIRIAKTELGDETLALADEECLSASVGFGVGPQGQTLDRRTMTRRINKAYLDHISLVESPAYVGARVLGVREELTVEAAALDPIRTPLLDEFLNDPVFKWTSERFQS
jgi:HK97 family phage prohead protease